jgi:hypothetical protein
VIAQLRNQMLQFQTNIQRDLISVGILVAISDAVVYSEQLFCSNKVYTGAASESLKMT